MKHIAIVQAGNTFSSLAQEHGDFDQWIANGIDNAKVSTVVIDARGESGLPSPNDIAGAVITGSHAMVTEHAPWSEALAAWLRELVAHQVPVLGICYGHQLLAYALGGEVGYHPGGIEIGTVPVTVTEAAVRDVLFGELPSEFPAQAVHRQSVRRLPPEAVLLARNGFESHHAFRVGESAWGVQFHPEFSSTAMSRYVQHLGEDLRASGTDVAAVLENVAPTDSAALILRKFGEYVERKQGLVTAS